MLSRLAVTLLAATLMLALAIPAGADLLEDTASLLDGDDSAGDEEPVFVSWTDLAPALAEGYDPTSSNVCRQGHIQCVWKVIRIMDARFDRYARECDHNAIFSLAYLRTTEEYLRTVTDDPEFFEDTPFLNHWDAVFAGYYFDAEDDWRRGHTDELAPAWRIAFAAADNREVSATGNLMLGMNAHINRDLAFTLAEIGLVAPDGSSRKADHDRVNEFLNRVTVPLRKEIGARFDPSVTQHDSPGYLDAAATFQIVAAWREQAWRNAERLVGAPDATTRAQIAQEIEEAAALEAQLIRAAFAYGLLDDSGQRDAFCAANG